MKKQLQQVSVFLIERKSQFVEKWQSAVNAALPPDERSSAAFSHTDFSELFDAYLSDGLPAGTGSLPSEVTELIKKKIRRGFPLSMIGIINAYFMAIAREMIRAVYPDSFDARMEYLEQLSQRVLNNEIVLSQYFEDYVHELNAQLKEQTNALERRHDALLEFIDCATQELQAPLWSILGFTAKLQRKYYTLLKDDGKHCLNRISANVAEMHQLITDMTAMLLIEEDVMQKSELSLSELISQSEKLIKRELDENFTVIHHTEQVCVLGDQTYLGMLFYHLFKNAAQYTKPNTTGRVHIRWEKGNEFNLSVEDEGIGIACEYRELVFKPLERLKEKEVEGSGLGLSFARRIVAGHKGTIGLEDSGYGGVCVHLKFPLAMITIKD